MNTPSHTYTANMDALRDQIADLLQPQDDEERALIQWLRDSLGVNSLVTIRGMAERAVQRHIVNDQLGELVGDQDAVNRARPSGDLDPNEMGNHGRALLNDRADRSRSEWYWAGYRDGMAR